MPKAKQSYLSFFMRECVLYYKKYGCFFYEINKCVTRMFLVFYKQERNVLFYKNDCFFSRPFPAGWKDAAFSDWQKPRPRFLRLTKVWVLLSQTDKSLGPAFSDWQKPGSRFLRLTKAWVPLSQTDKCLGPASFDLLCVSQQNCYSPPSSSNSLNASMMPRADV